MENDKITIVAPCDGEIINMEDVADPVFSGKLMGDGFAILPTGNDFIVPVTGEMTTVFETKHAYGIKNDNVEVLVHIGVDSVNLNGEGFETFVSQGDQVKQGDKMCTADIKLISEKSLSIHSPVIITNKKPFDVIKKGKVKAGDVILKLK